MRVKIYLKVQTQFHWPLHHDKGECFFPPTSPTGRVSKKKILHPWTCTAYLYIRFGASTLENLSWRCTIKTFTISSTHHFGIVMCTQTYCLWYIFTASLILSCRTLINIIMQNKESDSTDKKTVSSIRSWRMLINIMQNKVSEIMIKNSVTSLYFFFMIPLLFSWWNLPKMSQKSISVYFKGQGFKQFHYYCSASVCNLTTRVSHRCNKDTDCVIMTICLLCLWDTLVTVTKFSFPVHYHKRIMTEM